MESLQLLNGVQVHMRRNLKRCCLLRGQKFSSVTRPSESLISGDENLCVRFISCRISLCMLSGHCKGSLLQRPTVIQRVMPTSISLDQKF